MHLQFQRYNEVGVKIDRNYKHGWYCCTLHILVSLVSLVVFTRWTINQFLPITVYNSTYVLLPFIPTPDLVSKDEYSRFHNFPHSSKADKLIHDFSLVFTDRSLFKFNDVMKNVTWFCNSNEFNVNMFWISVDWSV